jgi:hypothetical protein
VNLIDPLGLEVVIIGRKPEESSDDEIVIIGSRLPAFTPAVLLPGPFNDPNVTCDPAGCDAGVVITGKRNPKPKPPAQPGPARKAGCIAPSDGPVIIKGVGFNVTMGLGGGVTVGTFKIPSIGASGWFSSGSANIGWEGFFGGTLGVVDTFGHFVGTSVGISAPVFGPVGSNYSLSNGRLSGSSGTFGVGGGGSVSYGGTHITSSNIPLCNG